MQSSVLQSLFWQLSFFYVYGNSGSERNKGLKLLKWIQKSTKPFIFSKNSYYFNFKVKFWKIELKKKAEDFKKKQIYKQVYWFNK